MRRSAGRASATVDACFTGVYPLAGSEDAQGKDAVELPVLTA